MTTAGLKRIAVWPRRISALVSLVALAGLLWQTAIGDEPPAPPDNVAAQQQPLPRVRSVRDTVVDHLLLRNGTVLKGLAVSRKPPRLLVRTSWLQKHAAEFLEQSVRPVAQQSLQHSRSRLKELLISTAEAVEAADSAQKKSPARQTLLEEVLQRLEPNENELPSLIVVESSRTGFRTHDLRTDSQRVLCSHAMAADLADLENLHWKTIATRLQQTAQRPLAMPQAAGELTDDDLQRAVLCILAAIDVRTNNAVRLVRSGATVIDEENRPDPAQLLQAAAGQSLNSLLQELLAEAAGPAAEPTQVTSDPASLETLPAAAAQIAAQKGLRTVVLSEFSADLQGGTVQVRRALWYQNADKSWQLTAFAAGSANAADIQASELEALQDDPQVQQITQLAAALQLPAQQLQTALGMGAAVQRALQQASTQFEELLQQALTAKLLRGTQRPLLIRDSP